MGKMHVCIEKRAANFNLKICSNSALVPILSCTKYISPPVTNQAESWIAINLHQIYHAAKASRKET